MSVNEITVVVFVLVYVGMLLGRYPRLQLDRTGIALLGAIVLLSTETIGVDAAIKSVDMPTIALLFALMVVSVQLRLGGFYTLVTRRLTSLQLSPPNLLAMLILAVAGLSAVFSNDIICLAAAPVLIDACVRRKLDPVPFLLALACSANVGSAATLIGNPQNMLIGQTLKLSFSAYLANAIIPVLLGLMVTWLIIVWQFRGRWMRECPETEALPREEFMHFDFWQAAKGVTVASMLFCAFLFSPWPREMLALGGAGILMMSRKLHSRKMLGLVDWQLLVLFIGLFIVNGAMQATGFPAIAVSWLAGHGLDPEHPACFFVITAVLSNLVSNVPAVMLLLPMADYPLAGPMLALASTLAGNLLIVGSIANIIVVDAAARRKVRISWWTHARTGIPVTLATLAIAALYLWIVA